VSTLSLLLVLSATDTAEAGSFNPALEISLEHTDPETPADFKIDFGIKDSKDVNFEAVVSFIPADFGVVRGDRIPIGEPVGELDAVATLGLFNSACNESLNVHFDLLNATIDMTSTVSFDDLEEEAGDTGAKGFGTDDFAEDKDGNGLLDAIDHWPEFLARVTGNVQPFRRSADIAEFAGIPVLLQFLVYNPGTVFDLPGDDLDKLLPSNPALGFPTIVLLQNAGDPEIDPEPGPVTDFCTPLTISNVAYGSTYDADRDGTSNEQDTCPYAPHPPSGTHDADFDFLHSQCDPNDDEESGGRNGDEDGDGLDNPDDNCPLVFNQDQADADEDFIGDACDQSPDPDGLINLSMLPQAGTYTFNVFTVGQRDADNDGYANSLDTCPTQKNAGNPTIRADGDADVDGLDSACDPNDDPLSRGSDSDEDSDGYLNRQDNCPLEPNGEESEDEQTRNQNDEDFDAIGDVCDPDRDKPDGELIARTLVAEIIIGAGGRGGRPTNCPDCQDPRQDQVEQPEATSAASKQSDNDGSSTDLVIGIVLAVAAAVVVVGGAATLLLRRGG